MKRLQCQTCGAPLDGPGGAATLKCPYCSATLVVPGELRGEAAAGSTRPAMVLFSDDFKQKDSGWEMDEDSEGSQDYSPRGYRMRLGPDEWETYACHDGFSVEDAAVEVEITKLEGPDDAWYGLLVRSSDDGCYCFCYSADGWYGIYGYDDEDEDYTIAEANEAGLVRTGNATNDLRVVCDGKRLELHLNGKQALWVKNGDFESGDLELCMGREDEEGGRLEAVFNKLRVYAV